MHRSTITALAATAAALALPAGAAAHISVHPNIVPAGGFVTLNVRVPGEQQAAYAYKVAMLLPPGFTAVDTQNVPGWTVKTLTTRLRTPIQTDNGPVSQEVSEIIWTGDRTTLGRLQNGTFMQFPLSVAMPDNTAGQSLGFKTLEYYSNGVVARWIGPPSATYPTPTINVTAKGGLIEDIAGGEAGPTPGQSAATTATPAKATGTEASTGLATAALIAGILGLLSGGAALAVSRRRTRP